VRGCSRLCRAVPRTPTSSSRSSTVCCRSRSFSPENLDRLASLAALSRGDDMSVVASGHPSRE